MNIENSSDLIEFAPERICPCCHLVLVIDPEYLLISMIDGLLSTRFMCPNNPECGRCSWIDIPYFG